MTVVVVSGPPGAGKSTIGRLLNDALGCPLISRDEIREGVVRAGTPDPDMPTLVVDTSDGYLPVESDVIAFATET